ncbi:MAG: hypothetical protein ACOX44_11490 [Limnochordia bacterium]
MASLGKELPGDDVVFALVILKTRANDAEKDFARTFYRNRLCPAKVPGYPRQFQGDVQYGRGGKRGVLRPKRRDDGEFQLQTGFRINAG